MQRRKSPRSRKGKEDRKEMIEIPVVGSRIREVRDRIARVLLPVIVITRLLRHLPPGLALAGLVIETREGIRLRGIVPLVLGIRAALKARAKR